MLEKWSNQLLCDESDIVREITEYVEKQKENHIMKPKNSSFYDHMPSMSGINERTMSVELGYVTGQPIQLIVKGTPFTDEIDLIINSTKDGIEKILEILHAGYIVSYHNTELKKQEEKCIMKSKNAIYYYDNMPYTFSNENSEPACITVDKVIFNKRTTVILWKDGTKTKIRCSEKDQFDEETAVAICMIRKILGPGYKRAIRDILKTKAKRYE